jgi:hypothetical protein
MVAESIEIYAPGKKPRKMRIAKSHYVAIQQLIEQALADARDISLNALIRLGDEKLGTDFHDNVSWLIVLVKNDLAYRGKVDILIDQERNQIIRQPRKRFRSMASSDKSFPFRQSKIPFVSR